jgi:putative chitinase
MSARSPHAFTSQMKLTPDQLHKLFPGLPPAKCSAYAEPFVAALEQGEVDSRQRACAFVAQLGHESGDLAHLREIWGPTPAQSRYDVRADLGNTPERDGDGERFKGRGGLQRTGRKNYQRFKDATGVDVIAHPELLERPEYAFRSDALFWTDNNLNRLADRLTLRGDAADLAVFDQITRRINGGYNGRVDRQRRYLVAAATLSEDLFAPETPAPAPPSALDQVNAHINGKAVPPNEPIVPPNEPIVPSDTILIAKLAKNEGAQNVAKGLGFHLARPAAALFGALAAGNFKAWLGTAALAVFIVWIVYRYRVAIGRQVNAAVERILE